MKTLNKFNSLLILAAGSLLLAGCSSTPTKVETGPIHARTFSFINTGTKPSPVYADNRQVIHKMIQDAITQTLGSRGVSHVTAGGDITVAYLVITGNNASTSSINDYFGVGGDAQALHNMAQN